MQRAQNAETPVLHKWLMLYPEDVLSELWISSCLCYLQGVFWCLKFKTVVSSSRHWGSVAAVLGSAIGLSGNLEEIPELLCALVVLICKMGINCFIKTAVFTCSYLLYWNGQAHAVSWWSIWGRSELTNYDTNCSNSMIWGDKREESFPFKF